MGLYSELTPKLALVSFLGSLGALSFGYDNGWWGFILGAPYFNAQYGSKTTISAAGVATISLTSSEQSAGTGLGTAGIMIGCMIAPTFNERYGRKKSFLLLAVLGLIGALIQALSTIGTRYWVLIAGKIILNISVGIASAVVGVYLSECAPASLRGTLMSNYNIIQNIGYVIAAGTVYGVVLKTTSINWLLPICLQFLLPIAIILCSPILPESPRWLAGQGRLEEAAAVIKSLRKPRPGEDTEATIWAEVEEIKAAYDEMRRIHAGVGWLELFRGANLRRTLVAVGLQCLQQAQGVSFVANYILVTLLSLGISNPYTIVLILYVILLASSMGAFYFPDKVGRRSLLLIGSASGAVWMAILGAITTVFAAPTGAYANLLVASLFLWVAVFANTWSIIPWTVAAEIPSNPLREKTLALASWSGFGVGLAVGFIVPYIQDPGYGNIGGKIGFLWMAWSIVAGLFVYFFLPELKGRSLEELDYMFEARVGTKAFGNFDSTGMLAEKRQEHHTEVEEVREELRRRSSILGGGEVDLEKSGVAQYVERSL